MSRARRLAAVAAAGAIAAGLIGAVGGGTGPMKHEIQMKAVAFDPRELTVRLGDTIVFKNADVVRHNAVRREVFESEELKPGETFTWVPADTGTYSYKCTIHTRMQGSVRVGAVR